MNCYMMSPDLSFIKLNVLQGSWDETKYEA
jgi:hypothetical protein